MRNSATVIGLLAFGFCLNGCSSGASDEAEGEIGETSQAATKGVSPLDAAVSCPSSKITDGPLAGRYCADQNSDFLLQTHAQLVGDHDSDFRAGRERGWLGAWYHVAYYHGVAPSDQRRKCSANVGARANYENAPGGSPNGGWQGGHLVASSLGGVDSIWNMSPMYAHLNQGQFARLEKAVRECVDQRAKYDLQPSFLNHTKYTVQLGKQNDQDSARTKKTVYRYWYPILTGSRAAVTGDMFAPDWTIASGVYRNSDSEYNRMQNLMETDALVYDINSRCLNDCGARCDLAPGGTR